MDVWLIVLAVIVPVFVLVFSFYVLVYYQHPDDKWTNYFPKVVVVLGLSLALVCILMLPFDVANQGGGIGCSTWNAGSRACGGLNLTLIWQILFLLLGLWYFILIPFTMFFYESYEPGITVCSQIRSASIYSVIIFFVWIVILVITFFFLNGVTLPVTTYVFNASDFKNCDDLTSQNTLQCVNGQFPVANTSVHVFNPAQWPAIPAKADSVQLQASFLIYLVAFLSFIGWFFFAVYAGIGLVSLPLDLLRAFWYRPRHMPKDLYLRSKKEVAKRTTSLLEMGNKIKQDVETSRASSWRERRELRKLERQFKQQVIALEEDYSELKLCHEEWKRYNPLVPYCKFILGILSVLLSFFWVLHIILFLLARTPYPGGVPASFFLNSFFSWASKESGFALLGTIFVGLFCMYLLFCTMSGTAKLGLRFLIVEIHPLKVGATYMSSMLFNLSLLLLCVPPLIQFSATAFSEYIVLTEADTVFGQYVRFMTFFRYFFDNNVFVIAMLAVMVLAMIFLYFCGNRQAINNSKALKERIRKFEAENKRSQKTAGSAHRNAAEKAKGEIEMT